MAPSRRRGARTRVSSAQGNGEKKVATPIEQFKQFDITTDCSDHHYLNSNKLDTEKICFTNASSAVHKKIMQEWKILEENLPGSIYVRVYEGRIDILRAVIIGAPGTPYHDGLFFFDLVFPQNYPYKAPHVYYHSHGLRLNPNLYDNGYVCLSLLGTWAGTGNENWDCSSSTVLQVLISLQGLVLNEEPYFNEPAMHGTNNSAHHQALARGYKDNAFVLSCKTMQYIMKNPPKGFESFVTKHFCERSKGVLAACKAYMNGQARVGYFQVDDESSSAATYPFGVSNEFNASMGSLYPNLVESFNMIGAATQIDDVSLRKVDGSNHTQVDDAGDEVVETAVASKPKKKAVVKKVVSSKPKAGSKKMLDKETNIPKPKADKKAGNSKPSVGKKMSEKETGISRPNTRANSKANAGNKSVEGKLIGSKRKTAAGKQSEKSKDGATGKGKKRKLAR